VALVGTRLDARSPLLDRDDRPDSLAFGGENGLSFVVVRQGRARSEAFCDRSPLSVPRGVDRPPDALTFVDSGNDQCRSLPGRSGEVVDTVVLTESIGGRSGPFACRVTDLGCTVTSPKRERKGDPEEHEQ
jgi:hypothetical protein